MKTFKLIIFIQLCVCSMYSTAQHQVNKTDNSYAIIQPESFLNNYIQKTIHNNLLKLSLDSNFIMPFVTKNKEYVGAGNLLESLIKLSYQSRLPELLNKKNQLLYGLLKTQSANGYIGTKPVGERFWSPFDAQEMSYIIIALLKDYEIYGNLASKNAAEKMASFIIEEWIKDTKQGSIKQKAWKFNFSIAVERAFIELYKISNEKKYLNFCTKNLNFNNWDERIVIGTTPENKGHNYTYLEKALSQVILFEINKDANHLKSANKVEDFFLDDKGMVITGASGDYEVWHNTQAGGEMLGELCSNTYTIRLLFELLKINKNGKYLDMAERVIYNALLGAQSHDGRQICYFIPFEERRSYFPVDTYCCPNNYRRFISELPEYIYSSFRDTIAINLFTASKKDFIINNSIVTINQKTDYPFSDTVQVEVGNMKSKANFTLMFYVPQWSVSCDFYVNGKLETPRILNGFGYIERNWNNGDIIKIIFARKTQTVMGTCSQDGKFAVVSGPIVFGVTKDAVKLSGNYSNNSYGINNEAIVDLNNLLADPTSLSELNFDNNGNPYYTLKGWYRGLIPLKKPNMELKLIPYFDNNVEAIYFKYPNKEDKILKEDSLFKN